MNLTLWPIILAIICFGVSLSQSETLNDEDFDLLAASRKQNISADYTDLVDKELILNSEEDDARLITTFGPSTTTQLPRTINEGKNYTNLIRINELLDVFNIQNVGASWSIIRGLLGNNCSRDMIDYFQGLQDGDVWAIKSMLGFFFCYLFNPKI